MFGLIDCNNFYASCERVFNPTLIGKPVVVLSNNDGCIIARSNEAKALGIKMGDPAFKIRDIIEHHQVQVFSSNYTLYGDMSHRVMTTIRSFVPDMEVYSIDEAFLHFRGFEEHDLRELGQQIVRTTSRNTGIPVSLGIAPTKTLAKVANKFAKKYAGYQGVSVIDTEAAREKALRLTEIGDVWGIGRQSVRKLAYYSINTAWDFTQRSRSWVRKQMGVVGERTWEELRGTPCIELEMPSAKKSICTSRSFGSPLNNIETVAESVANYAASCARKLRDEHSLANGLMVFLHTNPFRADQPQYYNQTFISLPVATNDSAELVHYAKLGLQAIYKEGFFYKKAGVVVSDLVPEHPVQGDLFDVRDRDKYARAMQAMDLLNDSYGRLKVRIASQGFGRKWKMKNEKVSKCYTTQLRDIITVKAPNSDV